MRLLKQAGKYLVLAAMTVTTTAWLSGCVEGVPGRGSASPGNLGLGYKPPEPEAAPAVTAAPVATVASGAGQAVSAGAGPAAATASVAATSPGLADAAAGGGPRFVVDPAWPKQLPNNWIIGQVGGLTVSPDDHIFVNQRPGSLTEDEKGGSFKPPRTECCVPAPPVLEFDTAGNLLNAWGGPAAGYDWPNSEHGVTVDTQGNAWIAGNGNNDNQMLKFTRSGRFLFQIGKPGVTSGSNDTEHLGHPAGITVDAKRNEVYVADGYVNRRVIVFDSNTGAYKRHWGAYGNRPDDGPIAAPAAGIPSRQFNIVHCVKLSADDLVYVCDRVNSRVQVFTREGRFLKEFFITAPAQPRGGAWDLAFSRDPAQKYIFVADGSNNVIWTLLRETGQIIGSNGHNGRNAGQFHWVHQMSSDSLGNLYTGEVDTGKRLQKFVLQR